MLLGTRWEPGEALTAAIKRGPAALVDEMKLSRLRGRGGAGFPAGIKWQACRDAPGKARYVVCNADEGEPGNFKDRVLLATMADAVVEGMTLCALATGAWRGFIYLRGEYRFLLEHLEEVLARRRNAGCSASPSSAATGSTSTCRSTSGRAPTCAARNPRSSSRSRASAARRATARRTR